jgi:hypothetical protein
MSGIGRGALHAPDFDVGVEIKGGRTSVRPYDGGMVNMKSNNTFPVGAHCMRPKNVANNGNLADCSGMRAHVSAPLRYQVPYPAKAGRAGV